MADYKVQFPVFEGPLDLLLYLVRKQEVDIYEVNLTQLATDFIAYVDLMKDLDLDFAGDFLVMAATLMYIKSKELLPVEKQVQTEDDEDQDDPRWELIRQLVEYKKFKDAAGRLKEREGWSESVYPRLPDPDTLVFEAEAGETGTQDVFDLVKAVNRILKRFEERNDSRDIFEDRWSVSEKIEHVRTHLLRSTRFRFSELLSRSSAKLEIVVTFLALLELIRMKQVVARQVDDFEDIEIERSSEEHRLGGPNFEEPVEGDSDPAEGPETRES